MNLFLSLFEPYARGNRIELSKVISLYRENFSSLEIIRYDVEIKEVDFKNDKVLINADFAVFFRNKNDQRFQ